MKRRTAISAIVSFGVFAIMMNWVAPLLELVEINPEMISFALIALSSIISIALLLALIFGIVDRNRRGVRISAIIALVMAIVLGIIAFVAMSAVNSFSYAFATAVILSTFGGFMTFIVGSMISSVTKQPSKATFVLSCVGIPLWIIVVVTLGLAVSLFQEGYISLFAFMFLAAAGISIAFLILNIVFPIDKNVNFSAPNAILESQNDAIVESEAAEKEE